MIAFRVNRFILLILFTIGYSFASTSAFAQSNDSIAQGIIKVRKAPIPSEYHVKLSYNYDTKQRGSFLHIFGKRKQGEAWFSPPDPVTLQSNLNDSNQTLLDSSFIITFYNKQGNPEGEFDWKEYLSQYEHNFEWDDTSGIDSTIFLYEVNSRGQVKCGAIATADSSAMAMQRNLLPMMKKLWVWYPASRLSDDGRKQKKVSCIVRVQVYAVKLGYGQNLPLKIVD